MLSNRLPCTDLYIFFLPTGAGLARVLTPILSDSSSLITSISMGGNEGGGRGGERWSLFGVRPIVQKSPTDPGSETNTPGKNLLYGSVILSLKWPNYNFRFVCFSFMLNVKILSMGFGTKFLGIHNRTRSV